MPREKMLCKLKTAKSRIFKDFLGTITGKNVK